MNVRRILKPVAAGLLTIGILTAGVSPAGAVPTVRSGHSVNDTGWGFK